MTWNRKKPNVIVLGAVRAAFPAGKADQFSARSLPGGGATTLGAYVQDARIVELPGHSKWVDRHSDRRGGLLLL
jgi:hypothetical protein